jgi:cephalosporin-C deacetylase-like acetyl esterase
VKIQKIPLQLILCTFAATGCVHTKFKSKDVSISPLPENISAEVSYPKKPVASIETAFQGNTNYQIRHVELVVPVAGSGANKTVELDCYTPPRDKPLPVILIFPVSGGGYFLEEIFAKYFYRNGYAAIIVHRESAADRDPKTAQEINRMIRQSVLDNMRVVDWIDTRPEYDARRIGALGTSMGSFKATFLVALDPRIKAAVLGLTGGDIPYLLAYSKEGAWHHRGLTRRREAYLSEHHLTKAEFRHLLQKEVVWDPKAVAPSVDPKKVLLIIALCDTVVPTRTGRELRRLMHMPETLFVLSGHYTAYFYLPRIKRQTLHFFNERLK